MRVLFEQPDIDYVRLLICTMIMLVLIYNNVNAMKYGTL